MQRSQMTIGDPVVYPDYTHGRKGPLHKGTIRAIPTDPKCRVEIQSAKGYPVRRQDYDIHPAPVRIDDDQCPDCDERHCECMFSRYKRKIPLYYCVMCKKSYEPKGQLTMEPV